MNMKQYALAASVGLMAVSLATAALADNGKENKGKNDERQSEQSKKNAQSVFSVCKRDAKTALYTAEKASKNVLNTAKKTAKQVRKDAIVAANGDLAKIDTANAIYRSAITSAMNAQRIASDAAQTAYDHALTLCKLARVTPTPTPTP